MQNTKYVHEVREIRIFEIPPRHTTQAQNTKHKLVTVMIKIDLN
jgi:hypothetical protein